MTETAAAAAAVADSWRGEEFEYWVELQVVRGGLWCQWRRSHCCLLDLEQTRPRDREMVERERDREGEKSESSVIYYNIIQYVLHMTVVGVDKFPPKVK